MSVLTTAEGDRYRDPVALVPVAGGRGFQG
jgi:hypothetical protein